MTKKHLSTLLISASLLSIFSCATSQAPQRNADTPVKVVEAPPIKSADLTQVSTSANVQAAHAEVEKQLSKIAKKDEHSDEPTIAMKPAPAAATGHAAAASHAASGHEEVVGVEPEKALGWLKNGNIRFLKQRYRKDGQSPADVKRLAAGQKPHTIVVSCSDSRVPPELLFDQKLGEIFVIRTAGESLDAMGIGSIEYALSHLGARHVMFLGHTNCGAVKAACGTLAGGDAGSESLNALVQDIHPRLKDFKGKKEFSKNYVDESWATARGGALELANRSQIVHKMLSENKIMISTAVYDLESGKVEFNK